MAKKLTGTETTWSRAVLHDIFEAGGIIKFSKRTDTTNLIKRYGLESQAKAICDEIKFRTFNFKSTDAALDQIASRAYFYGLEERKTKSFDINALARIIAAFCAQKEIFWDDVNTLKTTVEMDTYRMSALGQACWDFECFLSQQEAKGPSKFAAKYAAKRTAGAGKAKRATGTTAGSAPKSGYKSSGGRSKDIKGLIGTPGEKITFSKGDTLYVIQCDSSKTKAQYVFIDPIAKPADPNKIKLGDPSGYTSCKLFFRTKAEAEEAIKLITSGAISEAVPDHITGFTLKIQPADANGYFNVTTEVGPAYIKASKLNEAIEEELEEDVISKQKFPKIDNIDVYSEAMIRYE